MCKIAAACALAALFVAGESSCSQVELERQASAMTGGDPAKGREAISRYGCATCHTIPGVKGADALVGPSLEHVASRSYVAGVLQNTPPNMIRWIQNPPEVDRLTAMPNLGVTDTDARDIVAYLYTLK
ncbi:MAG: c-type cytochrome [Acidobacteria bacterium]|nr:c-type cytochrome [Acidobacteriota bacterium]